MASAIFFNGRRINIPQAVTKIDASGLPSASPASVGIVAIVGQAEGGVPLSVLESNADATQPSQIQKRYRSGELRTAALFAFQPSADEAVPGGAQKIISVKVNPSVSAAVTLPDFLAADSLVITAKDSGLFTSQISTEVEAGTNHGKKITVVFEDQTEVFDDAGGEPVFDVLYEPGAYGYDTMTGALSSSAFTGAGTKDVVGQGDERDADIPAPGVVQVVSDDNSDTNESVIVYGLSGGLLVQETIALNGTTPVVGTQNFSKVLCAKLFPDSVGAGTILVKDTVIPTTLFTFVPGQLDKAGPRNVSNMPAASVITVSADADVAAKFVVIGTNPAGAVVSEIFDLTTANTTPVVGTVVFASVTSIISGDVPAARTVTMTMNAVHALTATFATIRKLVDRLNALAGFTANADIGNPTSFATKDCDFAVAVSLLSAANFYADTFVIAALLTSSSANVNAARAPGASLPPANTPGAVFLSGGSEGTTTITQWQQALDLLKKRRYNHIILLTRDPAVHAALLAHLVLKNGVLKSECQGIVGIGKESDGTGETRSQIQSQIQTLSSRHLAFVSQQVEKFDPLTGIATLYPPYMLAAVAAGTKAGSAIGEPMTHKTIIATDIANDSSWSVEDDASDLIDRGLMMYEKVDGKGIRCVRSITGYLADDNPVYGEYAANESLITSVFSLRNAIEKKVGGRGLANTAGAIKSLAFTELGAQVDEEIIFSSRGLQVDQIGDVFPVSVEIAPILGVNFIPITIHVALPTAQAA